MVAINSGWGATSKMETSSETAIINVIKQFFAHAYQRWGCAREFLLSTCHSPLTLTNSRYLPKQCNMSKTLLLVGILLISTAWQPSHDYLMTSGMSMTPEVHSLITMAPFLTILLLLIQTKWLSKKSCNLQKYVVNKPHDYRTK